jgi:hypothetical protein
MVYILKGKVSTLRVMAIIWPGTRTASSDAARKAYGGEARPRAVGEMLKLSRPR